MANQCALDSYWIMQENGTEQPKVYRCTRTMLKIRSTPSEGEQTAQMKEWTTESRSVMSNTQAIPHGIKTVQPRILKKTLHLTLCSCHCPD